MTSFGFALLWAAGAYCVWQLAKVAAWLLTKLDKPQPAVKVWDITYHSFGGISVTLSDPLAAAHAMLRNQQERPRA